MVSVAIVVAVLSPNIGLPSGLPAIRLEQLLAIVLVPALIRIHLRERALRRSDLVDIGFAGVVLSVAISVVIAPALVPSVGRSYRDLFQILRPLEYWIFYRLGRASSAEQPVDIGRLFIAFAVFGGILGILQAVGGDTFNSTFTAIWTPSHSVEGVQAGGRIVGTIGNANLFGQWSGWLALSAVAGIVAVERDRINQRPMYLLAIVLSAMTLVLSQSRSAGLAIFGAAGLMVLALLARGRLEGMLQRDLRRLVLAAVAVAAGAAVGLVVLLAPGGTLSSRAGGRFDLGNILTDASVVERVAVLHFAFSTHDPDALHALICDRAPIGSVSAGHEPAGSAAPSPAAVAPTTAAAITAARSVEAGFCASGAWSVAATSPSGMSITTDGGGYTLEAAADSSAPGLVLTSHPNVVLEPSLESWPSAQWHVTRGSTVGFGPALYGARSAEVGLAPGGVFDQHVLYTFAKGSPYTASIEARSADGAAHGITLGVEAWLINGDVIATIGHETATLPADGRWVQLTATFRTPPSGQVWVMRVLVNAPDVPDTITIDLDGASLIAGATAPTFAYVRDIDPAVLPSALPSFWESPVVGVGPMSNIEFGSFDNEYALTLFKFGVLGMAALLLFYLALIVTGIRAWLKQSRQSSGLTGLALAAAVIASVAYGIAAGVWYSYQLMPILMLWAGVAAAGVLNRDDLSGERQ